MERVGTAKADRDSIDIVPVSSAQISHRRISMQSAGSFDERDRDHLSRRMSAAYSLPPSQRALEVSSRSLTPSTGASGHTAVQIGDPKGIETAVDLLDPIPQDKQLVVEYNNMKAWVPAQFAPPALLEFAFLRRKKKQQQGEAPSHRQVLFSITGCCRPGEVLAFMGPSGSGKTTLLSIIGGRAQSMMKRKGSVTFNGVPLEKRLKRQIGFVAQDDLLYESLTVYETLYYAAMLRLPRTMSAEEKKDRVKTVITALGLDTCKDTIIGGFFRKGISGGERKRCSVGHELLINPSILLLDEPTSGLDSTTAMHLLTSLRKLAAGGRAIITTIHQPSSRLYQQLDKLLLLSKGHAMYYGRATQAVEWFDQLDYTLPYRVNAADFILDLASGDVLVDGRSGEEGREYLIECFEQYAAKHGLEGFEASSDADLSEVRLAAQTASKRAVNGNAEDAPGEEDGNSKLTSASAAKSNQANGRQVAGFDHAADDASTSSNDDADVEKGKKLKAAPQLKEDRWGATYMTQYKILFIRSVRTRRFQTLSKQDFLQFIIVGILTGLFWWQKGRGNTLTDAQSTLGLVFFELLFLSFRALFTALFTFPDEFKMLLKERASGMYKLSAFYFARTTSDLPMDMAIPTIFIVIVYFMGGLRTDGAQYFFENWFTVILVMLVTQSVGLLLGTVIMVPKTAQTIASIIMLTFVLTGGFFVTTIPVWISWFKYLSFIYYGFGLLLHIEFKGRTIYSCIQPGTVATGQSNQYSPPNPSTNPNCTPVPSLQQALRLNQSTEAMWWTALDACVLIGVLVVLRFLVYVALRKKTSRV